MTVYGKVNALLTAANATTGNNRTNLTAAVQDLIDGYGGGGDSATVTIKAPKNSTVSYAGASSGSVSIGSSGSASLALNTGTYTFTSVLNSETIYTKTVAILSDTTVNLFPDGAVYWYGLFPQGGAWDTTDYRDSRNRAITWAEDAYETQCTVAGTGGSATLATGCRYINKSFSVSGYSSLHALLLCDNTTRQRSADAVISGTKVGIDAADKKAELAYNIATKTEVWISFAPDYTGDKWIGFGTANNNAYGKTTHCYAIWLE